MEASNQIEKSAFFGQGAFDDPTGDILRRLASDPSLNNFQRSQLRAMVAQLSAAQKDTLRQRVSMVAGAGIGALIARFLLNMGLTGTILTALAGGAAGHLFGRPDSRTNGSLTNVFGQPYF